MLRSFSVVACLALFALPALADATGLPVPVCHANTETDIANLFGTGDRQHDTPTYDSYVRAVVGSANDLVGEGFLLPVSAASPCWAALVLDLDPVSVEPLSAFRRYTGVLEAAAIVQNDPD